MYWIWAAIQGVFRQLLEDFPPLHETANQYLSSDSIILPMTWYFIYPINQAETVKDAFEEGLAQINEAYGATLVKSHLTRNENHCKLFIRFLVV